MTSQSKPTVSAKWDLILSDCESLAHRLLEGVRSDVLSVATETVAQGFSTKSTIGLMIKGLSVDNLVIGGPAYSSQQLHKGDEILSVDGAAVTAGAGISKALLGSDVPGSLVTITIKKKGSGVVKSLKLRRIASEELADRRAIFEKFTFMKQRATKDADRALGQGIDKCIELWTKMCIAESRHAKRIQSNVERLQQTCDLELCKLKQLLSELRAESDNHGDITMGQGTFDSMKTALKEAKQGLGTAQDVIRDREQDVAQLRTLLQARQKELDVLKVDQDSRDRDFSRLQGLVDMADQDCRRVQLHVLSKEEIIQQKDRDLQGWRRDMATLETQVREKVQEAVRQQQDLNDKDTQLQRLREELAAANEALHAAQHELCEHAELLADTRAHVESKDEELARVRLQVKGAQGSVSEANARRVEQARELARARDGAQQSEMELAESRELVKGLRAQLDRLDASRRDTQRTLLHETQRADAAEQGLAQREVQVLGLSQEAAQLQGRMASVTSVINARLSELQARLLAAESRVAGARGSVAPARCESCARRAEDGGRCESSEQEHRASATERQPEASRAEVPQSRKREPASAKAAAPTQASHSEGSVRPGRHKAGSVAHSRGAMSMTELEIQVAPSHRRFDDDFFRTLIASQHSRSP